MNLLSYLSSAFEENIGELSIMRISIWLIITTACGIAIYFAIRGNVTASETGLVCGMLTVALAGKVGQKIFEK